jgi:hypothetical protein
LYIANSHIYKKRTFDEIQIHERPFFEHKPDIDMATNNFLTLFVEIVPAFHFQTMSLYKFCGNWDLGGDEVIIFIKEWGIREIVNIYDTFKMIVPIFRKHSKLDKDVEVKILKNVNSFETLIYSGWIYYETINPEWFGQKKKIHYCSYSRLRKHYTERKILVPFGKGADECRVEYGVFEFMVEMIYEESPIQF